MYYILFHDIWYWLGGLLKGTVSFESMLFNTGQSARCLALQVPTNPDKACRAEADLAACSAARHFHGTIVDCGWEAWAGTRETCFGQFPLVTCYPDQLPSWHPPCSCAKYAIALRLVSPSDVCCRQYFYDNRDFIARRRGEEEKGSGEVRVRCRICYYDGNKIGLLNRAQCGAAQLFTRFPRARQDN